MNLFPNTTKVCLAAFLFFFACPAHGELADTLAALNQQTLDALDKMDLAAVPSAQEDLHRELVQKLLLAEYDRDGDGILDAKEEGALRSGDAIWAATWRQYDNNGDGRVDIDETLIFMRERQSAAALMEKRLAEGAPGDFSDISPRLTGLVRARAVPVNQLVPAPVVEETPVPEKKVDDHRLTARILRKFDDLPGTTRLGFAIVFMFGLPILFFSVLYRRKRIGTWLIPSILYVLMIAGYAVLRPDPDAKLPRRVSSTVLIYESKELIKDSKALMKDRKKQHELGEELLQRLLMTREILVLPAAILLCLIVARILSEFGLAHRRPNRVWPQKTAMTPPPDVAALMSGDLEARLVNEDLPQRFAPFEYDYPYIKVQSVICDLRDWERLEQQGICYLLSTGTVVEFGKNKR